MNQLKLDQIKDMNEYFIAISTKVLFALKGLPLQVWKTWRRKKIKQKCGFETYYEMILWSMSIHNFRVVLGGGLQERFNMFNSRLDFYLNLNSELIHKFIIITFLFLLQLSIDMTPHLHPTHLAFLGTVYMYACQNLKKTEKNEKDGR